MNSSLSFFGDEQVTYKYVIEIFGKKIGIFSNMDHIIDQIYSRSEIYNYKERTEVDYSIYIIFDSCIAEDYSSFVGQNDIETRMDNIKFKIDDGLLIINHFPNHSICFEKNNIRTVVASQKCVLIFYLRYYIKQLLCKDRDLRIVHASAVDRGGKASIIVGSGHSGKSYCALSTREKYSLIDDDMINISLKDNCLYAEGMHLYPSAEFNKYGKKLLQNKGNYYYCKYLRKYYLNDVNMTMTKVPIDEIIFLSNDKDSECIKYDIQPKEYIDYKLSNMPSVFFDKELDIKMDELKSYLFDLNSAIKHLINKGNE